MNETAVKSARLLRVSFCSLLVISTETVLFHVMEYLYDYFQATMVIAYALLGLAVGSVLAGTIRLREDTVFAVACGGAAVSIAVSFLAVTHPPLWRACVAMPLCFAFPVWYISTAFRDDSVTQVYFADMVGVFFGVVATVALIEPLRSEGMLCLLATAAAAAGIAASIRKPVALVGFSLAAAACTTALVLQVDGDKFNFHLMVDDKSPNFYSDKVFTWKWGNDRPVTYDNIVGRVDVFPKHKAICYNGYANDHYDDIPPKDYKDHYKGKTAWPSMDPRVLYGPVNEPRVFVIGSAAQGIIKTLRRITPLKKIVSTEINPAIMKIMKKDFFVESGKAYKGLNAKLGNALSMLNRRNRTYDVITLINTHPSRTIGHRAGPDHLHTLESYNLYFDRLSDQGYLMFEERPMQKNGKFAVLREINTLWAALRSAGASDPAKHLMIWEWQTGKNSKFVEGSSKHYIGMAAFKKPLTGERLERANEWWRRVYEAREKGGVMSRLIALPGEKTKEEYDRLFGMIEKRDFRKLLHGKFDGRIVTSDRPYLSIVRFPDKDILRLLASAGIACAALLCIAWIPLARRRWKVASALGLYNAAIGIGYFLIEVVLLQAFQNYFFSPTATFILVLGLMLLSSGAGGLLSNRIGVTWAMIGLVPLALLASWLPSRALTAGAPLVAVQGLCIFFICAVGFLMGVFFPSGLSLAKSAGLGDRVPHLFAVNSIAGAFSVAFALFLGVSVGYRIASITALAFYGTAATVSKCLVNRQSMS